MIITPLFSIGIMLIYIPQTTNGTIIFSHSSQYMYYCSFWFWPFNNLKSYLIVVLIYISSIIRNPQIIFVFRLSIVNSQSMRFLTFSVYLLRPFICLLKEHNVMCTPSIFLYRLSSPLQHHILIKYSWFFTKYLVILKRYNGSLNQCL